MHTLKCCTGAGGRTDTPAARKGGGEGACATKQGRAWGQQTQALSELHQKRPDGALQRPTWPRACWEGLLRQRVAANPPDLKRGLPPTHKLAHTNTHSWTQTHTHTHTCSSGVPRSKSNKLSGLRLL